MRKTKVDYHELVKMWAKDVIHYPHDNGKNMSEAKIYNQPFIEIKLGLERCLLDIMMLHTNLVIA